MKWKYRTYLYDSISDSLLTGRTVRVVDNHLDDKQCLKLYYKELGENLSKLESNKERVQLLRELELEILNIVAQVKTYESVKESTEVTNYKGFEGMETAQFNIDMDKEMYTLWRTAKKETAKYIRDLKKYSYNWDETEEFYDIRRMDQMYSEYKNLVLGILEIYTRYFNIYPFKEGIEVSRVSDKKWLTEKEAEAYVGLKRTSLYKLRKSEVLVSKGNPVRYLKDSLDNYLEG